MPWPGQLTDGHPDGSPAVGALAALQLTEALRAVHKQRETATGGGGPPGGMCRTLALQTALKVQKARVFCGPFLEIFKRSKPGELICIYLFMGDAIMDS